MGAFRCVRAADGPHDLAGCHITTLDHADLLEVEVKGVDPVPVAQHDRGSVALEGAGQHHATRPHGSNR